jgi:hypothetical protein
MWSLITGRRHRAVLSALSAVGNTGMSVSALGVAVDLPEAELDQVLTNLERSGRVDRVEAVPLLAGSAHQARYHISRPSFFIPAPR